MAQLLLWVGGETQIPQARTTSTIVWVWAGGESGSLLAGQVSGGTAPTFKAAWVIRAPQLITPGVL